MELLMRSQTPHKDFPIFIASIDIARIDINKPDWNILALLAKVLFHLTCFGGNECNVLIDSSYKKSI